MIYFMTTVFGPHLNAGVTQVSVMTAPGYVPARAAGGNAAVRPAKPGALPEVALEWIVNAMPPLRARSLTRLPGTSIIH